MILNVYSLFDSKVSAFAAPVYARTKGEAIRNFMEACSDSKSVLCKYPQDYSLYELGSYNDNTAQFICHISPQVIAKASDFVSPVLNASA